MARSTWRAAVRGGSVPSRLAAVGAAGIAAAVVAAPVAQATTPAAVNTSGGGSAPADPGSGTGASARALAVRPLDDEIAPDYGTQKVRVGVQREDGASFPPGSTLVGAQITAVQTGPDTDWDGTVTCTITSDPLSPGQPAGSDGSGDTTGDQDSNPAALCTDWGADTYSDASSNPGYAYYVGAGNSVTFTETTPPTGPGMLADQNSYTVGPCLAEPEDQVDLPLCTMLSLPDDLPAVASVRTQVRAAVPMAVPGFTPFGAAVAFVVRPVPPAPPVVVTPPPTAVDDTATTPAGTAVAIAVLANDDANGGGALSISALGSPAHGTAVVDGSDVRYTPAAGFAGTDSFSYTAATPYGSSTATVTVTVVPPAVVTTPGTPAPSSATATHTASTSPASSLGVLPKSASRTPGPPLAATGVPSDDYLGVGAGLVALGGALTLAGRRRRRAH